MKLGHLIQELRKHHKKSRSWRATGKAFGITPAMAYRIAVQGYEPRDARIRRILKLPVMMSVPACTYCGQVHISRRCPQRRRQRRKLIDYTLQELREMLKNRRDFV